MKCKLCQKESALLKQSHIIPNFMYKDIYDEKHFLIRGSASDPKKMGQVPTGEYDSDILCQKCDNEIIGSYEQYGSRALYGGELPSYECPNFTSGMINDINVIFCEKLNYEKFKLFLLSVLWRASISHRKFFQNVNLGDDEDIIRQLILSGNAGDDNNYPVIIITFLGLKGIPTELIGQPLNFKKDDISGHSFLINGSFYMFFNSGKGLKSGYLEASINKSNRMQIFQLRAASAEKFIRQFVGL